MADSTPDSAFDTRDVVAVLTIDPSCIRAICDDESRRRVECVAVRNAAGEVVGWLDDPDVRKSQQVWFTVDEACRYLRLGRSTLEAHMSHNNIQWHERRSVSGQRRQRMFRRDDLDAFFRPVGASDKPLQQQPSEFFP